MTSFERKYNGQAMRALKRIIDLGRSESQPEDPYCICSTCELVDNSPANTDKLFSAGMLGICLVLAALMLIAGCFTSTPAHAEESIDGYKVSQYVEAIGKAENSTRFPYGIKNVDCSSKTECRNICRNTVRNNIRRYRQYGYKNYPCFVQYLGSKFCPTSGAHLTVCERRLNRFWIANVSYFLKNERIS